ncbi:MAG: hypothetical protein O3B84_01440, partial [Chloroflexi bacterium]|nr:hypothetical protein [Chloroflexota bacterium]
WNVLWRKRVRFLVSPESAAVDAPQSMDISMSRACDNLIVTMPATRDSDGGYATEFTPLALSPHAFTVTFESAGQRIVSRSWAVEIARDGEEGIRADANGTSYVYQVRFNWPPGPIAANDSEPIILSFEIMRGIQEGPAIAWDRPWLNQFNHVTNGMVVEAVIASTDGRVTNVTPATYRGMGVYAVPRIFAADEVGTQRTYGVRLSFTDPYNGARVSNRDAYVLQVGPPSRTPAPAPAHH